MILEEKHDERMIKISEDADRLHDSAIDFLQTLKRLSSNTGRNSHNNLLKFEKLIQGNKNG